jgi:hypothetical protein
VFSKFFESIYLKIFVNIIVKRTTTEIYIESCTKKNVCERDNKIFQTTKVTNEMKSYINSFTKESPYSYISVLDYTPEQGALPTCTKEEISRYRDLSNSKYKCYNDKWLFFTSKSDLYEIERHFEKIGIDFIFSPYSVMNRFFKDKIDSHIALYAVIQDSYVSLAVFEHSELKYADHLDLQHSQDPEEDMLLLESVDDDNDIDLDFNDEGIDLEDVDVVDDVEALDDFGNIEELDSLEEIDEFSENKDIEEEFYEADEVIADSDDEEFNEDYQRFYLIQSSLGHYYSDKRYKSDFIENIYIADGIGVSKDLKRYLEDEMFLNVYIRHVELTLEICELAKMELKS